VVNVDVAQLAALRNDLSVYDFLSMAAESKRQTLAQAIKNPLFVKFINDSIAGKCVRARYGNGITYRLDRLDAKITAQTAKFEIREKRKARLVTVLEYFVNNKNMPVKNINAPLLVARIPPKDKEKARPAAKPARGARETPTWLIPEFMEFSIGEKRPKELNALERSDIPVPPPPCEQQFTWYLDCTHR
jgi:hypothetical protein